MTALRLLVDRAGTAAAEMALILPLLLVLLFGGVEAGHFIWTQHKLTEAVRGGARFAGRLPVAELCDGATALTGKVAEIKLMTRTGQIQSSSVAAVVPHWTDAQVDVDIACQQFVATGIYDQLGEAGPVVTVTASRVPYPSIFGYLGIIDPELVMTAKASSPGVGL